MSLVDQLLDGLYVTASSVPLRAVGLLSNTGIVGKIDIYTLTVQINNNLPSGATMNVIIPTTSFGTNTVVMNSFYQGNTLVPGCTMTTLSVMSLQFGSSCFPVLTPALTILKITLSNITNPLSTKPSASWQVSTYYNTFMM